MVWTLAQLQHFASFDLDRTVMPDGQITPRVFRFLLDYDAARVNDPLRLRSPASSASARMARVSSSAW